MPSRNRGKPRKSLRDLSRVHPTAEERDVLRRTMAKTEAQIATAILGASIIEYELETELRPRFRRHDDDVWTELTDERGPLGTFSQKIVAAYALGIIDDVIRQNVDAVRRIRNAFAHSKVLIEFDHELIKRELSRITLPNTKQTKLYNRLASVQRMKDGPRVAYAALCLTLALDIVRRRKKRTKAKAARKQENEHRKALADALRHAHETGGTGFLGLFGRSLPVDPKETILGSAFSEERDPQPTANDSADK